MLAHERGPEGVRRGEVGARRPPYHRLQVLLLAGPDRVVSPAVGPRHVHRPRSPHYL
jgi:hypothetical protein